MNRVVYLILPALLLISGCSFVANQLNEKAREESLLKPGALDPPIMGDPYYVRHTIKVLAGSTLSFSWPNLGNLCAFPSSRSEPGSGLRIFDSRGQIIEENNSTYWLGDPSYAITNGVRWKKNFDRYVKEHYVVRYTTNTPNGDSKTVTKIEAGLNPICFQAWVGTNHTLILRLHKRDLDTWKRQWSKYNPAGIWSEQKIGNVTWSVLENSEENMDPTDRVGGWYKSWIAPIGDTGYGISVQLGATKDSLRFPAAHANFKKIFRHIIESVRIDPLTPQVEAEIQQAKRAAFDLSKKECLDRKRRNQKPYPWCGD